MKSMSILKEKQNINIPHWIKQPSICVNCQMGKSCKLPFEKSNSISKLWGPMPILSSQHFKFYAIFVDDFSQFTWLYPLKRKSYFWECFIEFQKLVENQIDKRINFFQSDSGAEFNSKASLSLLHNYSIQSQIFCPNTLEQNGVAEHKHKQQKLS